MLKKSITYEDYNGETLTEDFYFNLTKVELVELEVSEKDGLANKMAEIVRTEDKARIIQIFQELILASYGVKSEDGKRFIKSDDLSLAFSQTPAYVELFIELSTNAKAASEFVNGVVPKGLAAEVETALPKDITEMSREELLEAFKKKAG